MISVGGCAQRGSWSEDLEPTVCWNGRSRVRRVGMAESKGMQVNVVASEW